MKGLAIFLGGVAVGAVAGLLLAPEKGDDARARLKDCLRRRGLLPYSEIDLLIEEISSDPEAGFEPAYRPEKEETGKAQKK